MAQYEIDPPPNGCYECWSRGPNPKWDPVADPDGLKNPIFVWFNPNVHEDTCLCECHKVAPSNPHPSRPKPGGIL